MKEGWWRKEGGGKMERRKEGRMVIEVKDGDGKNERMKDGEGRKKRW